MNLKMSLSLSRSASHSLKDTLRAYQLSSKTQLKKLEIKHLKIQKSHRPKLIRKTIEPKNH